VGFKVFSRTKLFLGGSTADRLFISQIRLRTPTGAVLGGGFRGTEACRNPNGRKGQAGGKGLWAGKQGVNRKVHRPRHTGVIQRAGKNEIRLSLPILEHSSGGNEDWPTSTILRFETSRLGWRERKRSDLRAEMRDTEIRFGERKYAKTNWGKGYWATQF